MRIYILALSFIVVTIFRSSAQLWSSYPVWGGGEVLDVMQDVTDTNTYYCITTIAGVFKSSDKGESWKSLMSNLSKQYAEHYSVRAFAINPIDHNKLYAVCGQSPWTNPNNAYLFRSNDAGETWSRINLPFSVSATSHSRWGKNTILINPNDTAQIFCGAQMQYDFTANEWLPTGGVYKSSDGGYNWSIIAADIEYMWVSGIAFAPADYGNKLIIAAERFILNGDTSKNMGLHQYDLNTHLFETLFSYQVVDFDFDANNTGVLMILSQGRLYVSSDRGSSWSPDIYPLWHYVNFYIKAHPTESGHWYIGNYNWSYSKIIETLNYGATWNVTSYHTGTNKSLIDYPNANICSFKPEFRNFPNSFTISKNDKTAFIADNSGIWKTSITNTLTSDGEEYNNANWHWRYVNKGLNIIEGRNIVSHPSGKVFLCGTYSSLFSASDNGNSTHFIKLPDNETTQTSDIVYSASNPNVIYVAGSTYYNGNGMIFKSTDGAQTWQKLAAEYFTISGNNINNVLELAISTYSPDTIIAGVSTTNSQQSVHRSLNGGLTWQPWSEGLPSNQIFQIWQRDNRLLNDGAGIYYLIYQDKLYSRKMNESQWQLTPLPQQGWLAQITTRADEPGVLYLVRYNNRIYKTYNRGLDWTEINTSPITCNYKIAVSTSGIIAVMSCEDNSNNISQKLFVSFDGGSTFNEISLNGITGMIRGITFTGAYTLSAWSENSGYYFLDLNLVGNKEFSIQSPVNLYPNPASLNDIINLGDAQINYVKIITMNGEIVSDYSNTNIIYAPSVAGFYIIEASINNEIIRKKLLVIE